VPPKKRWIAWVAGAAILVVVVLILASRDQAPEVQTVQVTRENLSASITSNGKVEPVQPFVAFAAFVTTVERLDVTAGQNVHKGQVLLVLNSAEPKMELAKARSDLLAAQAELRDARAGGPPAQVAQIEGSLKQAEINLANLQRTGESLKQLVAEKAATPAELEQNKVQIEGAQASVNSLKQQRAAIAAQAAVNAQSAILAEQQANSQIATYENQIKSATVTSPIDGTLYSLPVYLGKYVHVGEVLAEGADLHKVRVRAFVDEPDLGVLAPNQDVFITWTGLPGHVWTGKTKNVPKEVTTHDIRNVGEVLCSVQNSNMELIPNLSVDVRIEVSQRQNVLVVPRGAVHANGLKHFVFVVSDDTLHQREVKLGIADPTVFEVVSGLKEGERVALSGGITLHNGMTVTPVEANQ
jgi:HlyD family secretion protein